jgi:hypothetical protein
MDSGFMEFGANTVNNCAVLVSKFTVELWYSTIYETLLLDVSNINYFSSHFEGYRILYFKTSFSFTVS